MGNKQAKESALATCLITPQWVRKLILALLTVCYAYAGLAEEGHALLVKRISSSNLNVRNAGATLMSMLSASRLTSKEILHLVAQVTCNLQNCVAFFETVWSRTKDSQ